MTPAQLRAFAAVVRNGSVKAAAQELALTDSGVSMHIAQLRKSLGDPLFSRTKSGLAFTPGGLRLASRAVEILGLQSQTVVDVGQAAGGQRILRLGSSSLFAEYGAPGLIELFTKRANDLEVELSVYPSDRFDTLLAARAIDVAIGPARDHNATATNRPFLAYDMQVVAAPAHPLAGRRVSEDQLRAAMWFLGPAAISSHGAIATMLRQFRVPENNQRIFQSEAAALEETKRSGGLSLAVLFAVSADIAAERLVKIAGPRCRMRGTWSATALPYEALSSTAELMQFVTTPRAIQAMLRGTGVAIKHFRPSVHVTLWQ